MDFHLLRKMIARTRTLGYRLFPERWLLIVLLATLLKGLIWSAAIPVGQGPDEPSQVALVQFIAEQHRLPQAEEIYRADELVHMRRLAQSGLIEGERNVQQEFSDTQMGPNEKEILVLDSEMRVSFDSHAYVSAMFVPPLYHWLASLPYRLFYSADVLSRVFSMRLASVLLTMGFVWVSYWVARESFPQRPLLWRTVPIVTSFQPMVTFIGSVVNSDMLLFLLLGIATWLVIRALRRNFTWQVAAGLGIVTGLGLLTKPMILGYGLGLVIVMLILWLQKRQPWWKLVLYSLLIPAIALIISGWFMVRNQRIQGAPLYDNPYDNPHIVERFNPKPDLTIQAYWQDVFKDQLENSIFRSYWGNFGWLDTPMPDRVYESLRWVSRLAYLEIGLFIIISLRRQVVDWNTLWVLVVLVVLSLSLLLPMFGRAYIIARDTGIAGSSAQGRYLLGMWAAQATVLVFGLTAVVTEEAQKFVHGLISLSVIALNVIAFAAVLIPRYYL